eukprot:TRINITY_DN532_c0_g1_i1.p1 TRINITY_DN532_c0_g1~~TRINITY_DN532_c0_g1_i1.p1  ORF type:complete len:622 (-),score=156.03 TRINITY_DN532_c0_g1_i1:68-1837(-)
MKGEAEKICKKIHRKMESGETFFSFEYYPPRTESGTAVLIDRFDNMGLLGPLFIDITWSAGGSAKQDRTLELVRQTQDLCCLTVNMHLTCNNSTREELIEVLDWCKERGISNILALRGDPPNDPNWNPDQQEFHFAVDLVKLMREVYGDFFCISVAGYPNGHFDCPEGGDDVQFLKQKVDAGADFIVSQLFWSAEEYLKWTSDCVKAGITVPILPGILPIQGYASLRNITKMSDVPVPDYITRAIEPIKDDDEAILDYGVQLAVEMCKKLIAGGVPGLHFYTLNREAATSRILNELSLVDIGRELPWQKAVVGERGRKEDVRPIFWSHRTKSYLLRTDDWDKFPNGRWGDNRSPAYGDLSDYHLFVHRKRDKPEDLRAIWGEEIHGTDDISRVFAQFLIGEVPKLPWIDQPVSLETGPIVELLSDMNFHGFWTINSQPSVNGAPSSDPNVGWGPSGGYVYQKAYLEFFTSPQHLEMIEEILSSKENRRRYNYEAINKDGDSRGNIKNAIAVTWGVFPGTQIKQPTVVDPVSFKAWKDEAFGLWLTWKAIYEDENSRNVIQEIYDNYYLVTIVDNDFVKGDFISFLNELA